MNYRMKKNKICSLLLALLLIVTMFPLSVFSVGRKANADSILPGDLNGDGKITAADARLALRAAVGLEHFSERKKALGDVNYDGRITAADARLILRAAVGLEELENRIGNDTENSFLFDFTSSDRYFPVDATFSVTFSVSSKEPVSKIELYADGSGICSMNDNGTNGDLIADDRIYTCTCEVRSHTDAEYMYYAVADGKYESSRIPVRFFDPLTVDDYNDMESVLNGIRKIEAKFKDANGVVPEKQKNNCIESVEDYVWDLQNEGTVYNYEVYSVDGRLISLTAKLDSGLEIVFVPEDGETLSSGKLLTEMTQIESIFDNQNARDQAENLCNLPIEGMTELEDPWVWLKDGEVKLNAFTYMGSNQVILWLGHGVPTKKCTYLLTQETYDKIRFWIYDPVYFIDLGFIQSKMCIAATGELAVNYKYLQEHLPDLSGSFVFLCSCTSGDDNQLCNVFIEKGAASLVAIHNSIRANYGITVEAVVGALLTRINPQTDNYYTVSEALDFCFREYGNTDGYGAYPYIYPAGTLRGDYRITEAKTGTLTGSLLKDSDKTSPVANATVNIYRSEDLYRTVSSDDNGRIRETLAAGEYSVEILANGYASYRTDVTVEPDRNKSFTAYLLELQYTGKVTTRVIDENHEPLKDENGNALPDITVSAYPIIDGVISDIPAAKTAADSEGYAEFDLAPGDYELVAEVGGYRAGSIRGISIAKRGAFAGYICVRYNNNNAALSGTVSGTVIDNVTDQGIENVSVCLYNVFTKKKYETTTDNTGAFSVSAPYGLYQVELKNDSYETHRLQTEIANEKQSLKTVVLKRRNPAAEQYLVETLKPFDANDFTAFREENSVLMGGVKRYHGFTLDVYGWNGQSRAIYNLDGKYTHLSGITGYVDDHKGDRETWDLGIYADERLVYMRRVAPDQLPEEFSVDLTGVSKLEFRTGSTNGFKGLIGFGNLIITKDPTVPEEIHGNAEDTALHLIDTLQPFDSNDFVTFSNGTSIMMGGNDYYSGFTLDVYGWNGQSHATYNLQEKYSRITGVTGYVDYNTGDRETWNIDIYGDDRLLYSREVKTGQLPESFSVDISGVSKLEFRTGSTNGFKGLIGFADIALVKDPDYFSHQTLEDPDALHLVDVLSPYDANDFQVFQGEDIRMMGGLPRHNGFTLDVYGWNGQSRAIYNLEGKYSALSGLTAYVDGQTGSRETWTLEIFADDVSVYSRQVSPGELAQSFSIDLRGVSKLEFRVGSTNGYTGLIGFSDLVLK